MSREFTPAEAMEFFQKMWNPLGLPMPGMPQVAGASTEGQGTASSQAGAQQPPPFMPFPGMPGMPPMPGMPAFPPQMPGAMNPFASFDPVEVEKKINEFKAVEGWLQMQLAMLQMTIKTMEMQKASLEALQAQAKGSQATPGGKGRK
jgi:hypothetical protein